MTIMPHIVTEMLSIEKLDQWNADWLDNSKLKPFKVMFMENIKHKTYLCVIEFAHGLGTAVWKLGD